MRRKFKKYRWGLLAVLVVIVTGIAADRVINPPLPFKYFEPAYLPPGVSVKAKRISVTRGSTEAEQNFRTEDWVYSIREYKATEGIGQAKQDYDARSIQPTCILLTTSKGMPFRLCHWTDYGRIGVYEVKFIKEGTFVNAQIPTTLQQRISSHQMATFVDSFARKSSRGFPVLRSNGA
jgi:hypothetical protein